MRSMSCPRCQGSMSEGFIFGERQGMPTVSSWVEGAPEKGMFGVKLRKRKRIEVATWRCGRCGFLESYATGA